MRMSATHVFWMAAVLAAAGYGAAATVYLSMLAGTAAEPVTVLYRAARLYAGLGYLKYFLGLILLVLADYAVLRGALRGRRRTAVLWSPFVLFVVFGVTQWGFASDAYLRFARDYGLGWSGVSGTVFYMIVAFPAAFAVSLLNHAFAVRRQAKQ